MWVAGRPLRVKVDGDRYQDRAIGDPVPEASTWTHRTLEANRNLGRIVWMDSAPKPPKRKRGRPRKPKAE